MGYIRHTFAIPSVALSTTVAGTTRIPDITRGIIRFVSAKVAGTSVDVDLRLANAVMSTTHDRSGYIYAKDTINGAAYDGSVFSFFNLTANLLHWRLKEAGGAAASGEVEVTIEFELIS